MTTATPDITPFTRLRPAAAGDLQSLREAGLAHFKKVGLPSGKLEEWRFTNTDPLADIAWRLPAHDLDIGDDASCFDVVNSIELILVNGRLRQLPVSLPRGLYAGLLSKAPSAIAERAKAHLATSAGVDKTAFTALNAALLEDVTLIHAARGAIIEQPVHVMSLATTAGHPLLFCPRILVILEEGASLKLIETHAGHSTDPIFSNTVTEVFVGPDANLQHYQAQWSSPETWTIANTVTALADRSIYTHHHASLSGKLIRNDLEVILDGERADATLNGLVFTSGKRHVDNHTLIRHEKPNCTSHELYKHVVDGESFCVFKGRIFVQQDAQHTDSKQTSRTLLLTDKAMMESMPALEIHADDVKCTHGSTIGPLDEQMLFYLRSRGLSTDAARHLLIYAFAADMTARMKVLPARRQIEQFLAAQQDLPRDLSIEAT